MKNDASAPSNPDAAPGRGNWRQQARLASGLLLFAFCLSHFLNHALGIWSLELMEAGRRLHHSLWGNPVSIALLSAAALTHVALALWRTSRRRTLRLPIWETLQLALGFYIPWTLIPHALATVGLDLTIDVDPRYRDTLALLWPDGFLSQSLLLLAVWTHSMIGLHFWLRLKPFYGRFFPSLAVAAFALPLLSLWGWSNAARLQALGPSFELRVSTENIAWVYATTDNVRAVVFGLFACSLLAVIVRFTLLHFRHSISIEYPGGLSVRSAAGPSLLEISRQNGIPHAAVCGGRARCSTCRVRILEGGDLLAPPEKPEQIILDRIGADANIRLACQIRPTANLQVRPLAPVRAEASDPSAHRDAYYWGVEQGVVVMFIDLRNFTGLTEQFLPYDIVYLLNRYLEVVSQEIRAQGGHVDKFIGDGVMAIFGIQTGLEEGARQAIRACRAIGIALDQLNKDRGATSDAQLRVAMGVHAGPSVLGRIGAPGSRGSRTSITALGDVVNVASRLEGVAKAENALAALSRDVLDAAGLQVSACQTNHEVMVRGRQAPLEVVSFTSVTEFDDLLHN